MVCAGQDPELDDWITGVACGVPVSPGGFLAAIVNAALRADYENYAILRPALVQLKAKYPKYSYASEVPNG
jgi:hypothetical protein